MSRWPLVTLVALAACAGEPAVPPAPSAPARAVHVARAELRSRPTVEEVVGTVRAVRTATIAPTLSGRVVELRVAVGSAVRAGDVLVRLSAREIEARVEQTRAALGLAKLEAARAARLAAEAAASVSQHDTALAQLRIAEAARAEASTLAEHAVLRAPFDAVVTARLVNLGDTAMPGQPLLVLEAPGALRFEARVPEGSAGLVTPGRQARVQIAGLPGTLLATSAELDPAADAGSRTRLVKLDLPARDGLHAGSFGRLLLESGAAQAVTVAPSAIVRRGQLEAVFVVEDGLARLRLVRTARERDGAVEVVSGLAGGEQVAVSEAATLVDGQPVEVRL